MRLAHYLKAQLRADKALEEISEDACYAMIESLTLVPQLWPRGLTSPGLPLELRVLTQGKPKQRVQGPWARWDELEEWGQMALEQHAAAPHQWRAQVAEIAPRLPEGSVPLLARVMAYAAAYDGRAREDADPRDIGRVRDIVGLLASTLGAGDPAEWLAEGIDARASLFDWWWAQQHLHLLPDPQEDPLAFRAQLVSALRLITVAVPPELGASEAETDPRPHHLELLFTEARQLVATVVPTDEIAEEVKAAMAALAGAIVVLGQHETDDEARALRTLEAASWPGADSAVLASHGEMCLTKVAVRLLERRIISLSTRQLRDS